MTASRRVVSVAQLEITTDIATNLAALRTIVERCRGTHLLVLPEGVLSGYDHDPAFLDRIDRTALEAAIAEVQRLAEAAAIAIVVGTCLPRDGHWYNCALGFNPDGRRFLYDKVNLAHHERPIYAAGNTLDVWPMRSSAGEVCVGAQLCREIRFPEQWRHLARSGAEIFAFLSNAVGDAALSSVWRSHLISRAAENQRFVLAANNAHPSQKCPTMIVHPSGAVLAEVSSPELEVLSATIDLADVSNWYLDQSRDGLFSRARHPSKP